MHVNASLTARFALKVFSPRLILEHGRESLQAHPGVDMLVGELLQDQFVVIVIVIVFVDIPPFVEFDEDQIPDFDDVGVVVVNHCRGITAANAVVVNFRASTAGADVSHLLKYY